MKRNNEERNAHPYFMYDMIMETPQILEKLAKQEIFKRADKIAQKILERKIDRIYLTECVTSYCAGFVASYVFNEETQIPASPLPSFEIINYPPPDINSKTAVFVITHRGRTKIALEIVESLRSKNPLIIGVTDVEGSPITKVVDEVSMGVGGEEPTYPKTRSWIGSVFRLSLIALMIAKRKGQNVDKYFNELKELSKMAAATIVSSEEARKHLAKKFLTKRFYVVGGGANWATAQEGVLKLKEAGLVNAEAIEIEEIAHGPQLVLDKDSVVLVLAPPGRSYNRSGEILQAVNIIGSHTLCLARKGDSILKLSKDSIGVEENMNEFLSPMLYIIPIQLLAYYIALEKGLNPDRNPRMEKFQGASKYLFPPEK